MKQRPRIYYSDSQKALMWERWKQGWTLQEIGKLFDRAHSSIRRPPVFNNTGLWSPGINLTGCASAFGHKLPGSVRRGPSSAAPRCIPGAKPRRSHEHVPSW